MTFRLPVLLVLLLGLVAVTGKAEVSLGLLFQDHAVLQANGTAPVWGMADPGEAVTVSFGGRSVSTKAGSDGRWMVLLGPLAASTEGTPLVVAGKNRIELADILVGEVWLCSGQSNMAWPVAKSANAPQEIASANFPLIRHFQVGRNAGDLPEHHTPSSGWKPAHPQNTGDFSAVGYFFARDLHRKLGVPVGIINSSWGGSMIETWLPPSALSGDSALAHIGERWRQAVASFPASKAGYETERATYEAGRAAAKARGEKAFAAFIRQHGRAPFPPYGDLSTPRQLPSNLYVSMIGPLAPYGIRGVLWYQGEGNDRHPEEYALLFSTLIRSWRAAWGDGDLPFYFVQLPNFRERPDWPRVREAQAAALALPGTAMAVTIDIGDPDDIHPANKQEVARRLALIAKAGVYGASLDASGPVFASATREGTALRVRFRQVSSGLISYDKPVQSLELAGADRVFHPATAKIENDTLLVSSSAVQQPVAVRYAWSAAPAANLFNGAGLPAAPFRSDNW